MKLYVRLSELLNWNPPKGSDFEDMKEQKLELIKDMLPDGSGFDCGTKILFDECKKDKIVLYFAYHHLNSNGYYDGWTYHKVILKPTFQDYDILITGRDKNMCKDYFYDVLNKEIDF